MSFDHIRALVHVHGKEHIVRLIPVSAVGSSFVDLDAAGKVVKRADGEVRPTNVDVPLCAVLPDLFKEVEGALDESTRRKVNAEMLKQMRNGAGAIAASVLARPAGVALRGFLQGALGADVGREASTLFLEWMVRPSNSNGQLAAARNAHELQVAELQRLRGRVVDDFTRAVLRLEATFPSNELSKRW